MLTQGDNRVFSQKHLYIYNISSMILSYMLDSKLLYHIPYSTCMTVVDVAILQHKGATIQSRHACLSAVFIADV